MLEIFHYKLQIFQRLFVVNLCQEGGRTLDMHIKVEHMAVVLCPCVSYIL